MLNLEQIGKKISSKRKEMKMTQNTLAETLYVTHQAVSKWEKGKSVPSIEILYELTKLFNISIDYLLDDTDILEDDYETLFQQYPRASVLSKFLQLDSPAKDIEKIFYLLQTDERKTILDKIVSNTLDLDVEDIWHLLSKVERFYLLGVILSNKLDYDLNILNHQLTPTEMNLVQSQCSNGSYKYRLHHVNNYIK